MNTEMPEGISTQWAEMLEMRKRLPKIREEGKAALQRLLPVAHRNSGQSEKVAGFLLGLYNGPRFPYDMTNLRCLDQDIFEDCMAVLRMDSTPEKEVHQYFEGGGKIFEQLAKDWGLEAK